MSFHPLPSGGMIFLIRTLLIGVSLPSLLLTASDAQITLDGSLGAKGALAGPDYVVDATVGRQVGGNLFHSFGEFTVRTGESATFTGPNSVENILGRVTGGTASLIDGPLKSEIPGANLFLLNPQGVLFGPNAALNVGGSFHVSTADFMRFGDGAQFHADLAKDSVLSVAPPEAFGFLSQHPAPISIQESLLKVPEGKTLSVVGGDIQIVGRGTVENNLTARSGRINVASVASAGEVVPSSPGQPLDLQVDSFARLGRIELSQSAGINTSGQKDGQGGGAIVIRSGQLMVDNSFIFSRTRGDLDAQGIDVRVTDDLTVTNGGSIATVTTGGGYGGDLHIETGRLTLTDGGQLNTDSSFPFFFEDGRLEKIEVGTGDGGDLFVRATDSIVVSGQSSDGLISAMLSETSGPGDAGHITLSAPTLVVDQGGIISADTVADGRAGDITVDVGRLSLTSEGRIINGSGGIVLANGELVLGTGDGGNLSIRATDSISISSISASEMSDTLPPGGIASRTLGIGDAGQVTISTPTLIMEGGAITTATIFDTGRAGSIGISAEEVTLERGAIIDSSTFGPGQGGTVTITATDAVSLSGTDSNGIPTLLSTATAGSGNGGDINLQARSIQLTNGATVSASSTAAGNAGNVTITAQDVFRSEGSAVTTEAETADGGNIRLNAGSLVHLTDSQITATVKSGQGSGGNIAVDPQFVVLNGSEIRADAFGGPGGNVGIAADVFLASPDSVVSASSALGTQGRVDIQAPINQLSGGLSPLPGTFLSTAELLPAQCVVRLQDGKASSFVVGGRDGLPPEPGSVLPSPTGRPRQRGDRRTESKNSRRTNRSTGPMH